MTYLLCRNRVLNYQRWQAEFTSHADAHRSAGLIFLNLWRSVDDPDNVFFMFEVARIDRAREFIDNPESARAGESAGVVDGEYYFIEDAGGY